MIFEQRNTGSCKTYLIACETSREAILVDPVLTHVGEYVKDLQNRGLTLRYVIDTHVHADHLSGCAALKDLTGAKYVMHRSTGAREVDVKVDEGMEIAVGTVRARVIHTPGHTKDSMTVVLPDRILTGDFLFLGEGGAGRTDLLGGDAGEHWDSLQKLAGLSGEIRVFPGHDYHCRESSTLAEERVKNERLRTRSKQDYVQWLSGFKLGAAPWMVDVVRANFECTRDPKSVKIPEDNATCEVKSASSPGAGAVRIISPEDLSRKIAKGQGGFILDVRGPEEFTGELGHIDGATLIPLPDLASRLAELKGRENQEIYTVCKMGGRSAKAATILASAGFTNVFSMDGGMTRWSQAQLPVTR